MRKIRLNMGERDSKYGLENLEEGVVEDAGESEDQIENQ
jgi:hypothetical protein